MTKSSPVLKKKAEQDSILINRNSSQIYNTKFKNKGNFTVTKNLDNKYQKRTNKLCKKSSVFRAIKKLTILLSNIDKVWILAECQ